MCFSTAQNICHFVSEWGHSGSAILYTYLDAISAEGHVTQSVVVSQYMGSRSAVWEVPDMGMQNGVNVELILQLLHFQPNIYSAVFYSII